MSRKFAHTVDGVLRRSPAQPLFRWRAARRLVVLAYHEVPDSEAFAWQVDYLRTRMHPVSLADVITAIRSGRALPRRAVLITFDDGDRSIYERALPVLRHWGIPAVAFVIAGLLGTNTPFWWQEVEELARRGARAPGLPVQPGACTAALKRVPDALRRACIETLRRSVGGPPVTKPQLQRFEVTALEAAGIAIENHTLTHPCLDRCTEETLEHEVVRAHETLVGILGRAPRAFAYPNGNPDDRARCILERLGYDVAFLFDHRIAQVAPPDRFRVSRVRINATARPDRFRIIASGLHSYIHRLIGRA